MAEEMLEQEGQVEETPAVSEEELREAKALGWAPKEQWRGDPERWIDAKEFLERGENVLPILKSNNQRLKDELGQRDRHLQQVNEQLRQTQAAVRALEDAHVEGVKAQATETMAEIQQQIADASRDGDFAAVGKLTDRLVDLKLSAKELEKKPAVQRTEGPANPALQAEVSGWLAANPRFSEPRFASLANGIAAEMRQKGNTRLGAAFLNDVAREVDAFLGESPGAGGTKVSGGNGGRARTGAGMGGGGKGYGDLPADARQACDKMGSRFIGEGKKYKDQNSWRAAYARQYFAQE